MTFRDIILGLVILVGLFAYFWLRNRPRVSPRDRGDTFDLDSRQETRLKKALTHLRQHGEITNEEYREMVKVSRRHAVRDLDILEKQGYIKQVGKIGHQVKYKLIKR